MNDLDHTLPEQHAEAIEAALIGGDLSRLKTEERVAYYNAVCKSLDLNPLTRPFEYIILNGKLTLYARSGCAEQLRGNRRISIEILDRKISDKLCIVTARAKLPDGRQDESTGITAIAGLAGDHMANALMKAETKAKRRVTLSICGLGITDESELETIPRRTVANEADQERAAAATERARAPHVDPQAAAAALKQLPEPDAPVIFAPPAPPRTAAVPTSGGTGKAKEAPSAKEATPAAAPAPAPARPEPTRVDDLEPHERDQDHTAQPPSQLSEEEYMRANGEPRPGRRGGRR